MTDQSFFDQIGGRDRLFDIHGKFYDKVFSHPVIGAFFVGKKKLHQQNQLTDFMMRIFGGPVIYGGRMPKSAHQHMFITEDVFDIRHKLLEDTLKECGINEELREKWLRYDRDFIHVLVKKSIDECEKRYKFDDILTAPGVAVA